MKKRLAIIGAGNVACMSYLPFLSKREDLELLIHCRTFEKAKGVAAKFNGIAIETMAEVAAMQPMAALVLTKEQQHLEAAGALVDLGVKNIFIEKPLNAKNGQANVTEEDYFEAARFIRHANDAGCEIAMNFNYRFFELYKKLKSIAAERNFGELRQSSWFVNYACWSHCIDLLHFFGGKIKTVTALGEKKENADLAGAFFMENGSTGTILGTDATNFDMSLYYVTLHFDNAIVTFEDLDSELKIYENGTQYRESYNLFGNFSRWNQYTDSFEKSVNAYLASVENGEKPPVSGEDGLRELQFEAALRRSAALGRPVDFADMKA